MSDSFSQPVPYPQGARKQADQKFCHACGAVLHISAGTCVACGAAQAVTSGLAPALGRGGHPPFDRVFCRGCGQAIHHTAPTCPHCGAPQRAAEAGKTDKSRIAAAVLALVLGGLGFHKFYLGEVGWGIVYLLFSWTFIPAFIGAIEGLVYLLMSDARFARKYG